MTDQQAKEMLGGAAIAGLLSFAASMVVGANPIPFLIGGAILLGLVIVLAWLGYRRGNHWFAYGLLGGYGLLALMSAGQCTLLFEPTLDGQVTGFVFYPLVLVIAVVVSAVVSVVRSRRARKEGQE